VRRGLARRGREVISYLGVDEKSFQKRHEYVTVVCDLGARRVVDVGDGRGRTSLDGFYETLSEEQRSGIEGIAMDMWGPYIRSTLEHVPGAADKIGSTSSTSSRISRRRSTTCAKPNTGGSRRSATRR
jgi:transposase